MKEGITQVGIQSNPGEFGWVTIPEERQIRQPDKAIYEPHYEIEHPVDRGYVDLERRSLDFRRITQANRVPGKAPRKLGGGQSGYGSPIGPVEEYGRVDFASINAACPNNPTRLSAKIKGRLYDQSA